MVATENEGDSVLQERQGVEMPVGALVESASVKLGSDAVADFDERARSRRRAEGKRGQKNAFQDVLEPQAKTKARLEPRRGQKRGSTHVDSSCSEWLYFNSGRLELECWRSCQFFCGCEPEC